MSRSRKKPYVKDKGLTTREYWKPIRHNWKQHLKQNYLDPDLVFESPKSYINDYTYCDWWYIVTDDESPWLMWDGKWGTIWWSKEDVKKYSLK
jgi:hypothetical protein